jgi:hypothetical protein
LARMDIGATLGGVKLLELICRKRGRLVFRQIKGFARYRGVRPVATAGVVGCSRSETPGWRDEPVARLNVESFQVPAGVFGCGALSASIAAGSMGFLAAM